jgi:hypothetical protein
MDGCTQNLDGQNGMAKEIKIDNIKSKISHPYQYRDTMNIEIVDKCAFILVP